MQYSAPHPSMLSLIGQAGLGSNIHSPLPTDPRPPSSVAAGATDKTSTQTVSGLSTQRQSMLSSTSSTSRGGAINRSLGPDLTPTAKVSLVVHLPSISTPLCLSLTFHVFAVSLRNSLFCPLSRPFVHVPYSCVWSQCLRRAIRRPEGRQLKTTGSALPTR